MCHCLKKIKGFPAVLISADLFSDIDPGTIMFSSKNKILTNGTFVDVIHFLKIVIFEDIDPRSRKLNKIDFIFTPSIYQKYKSVNKLGVHT